MNPILVFFVILKSLSSILCLNCSHVRQSNELGVYVRRDREGGHSYWVYDRNGSEWEMHLKETNGEMDIDGYDDKTVGYQGITNRFGTYFYYKWPTSIESVYNCLMRTGSSQIGCAIEYNARFKWFFTKRTVRLDIKNPLVFKIYPMENNGVKARHLMAYNRHDKSDRVRLRMMDTDNLLYVMEENNQGVYFEAFDLEDVQFIKEMNDSLFSQIDSMLDYDLDHKRGLSGHMLWFNIDHKYYYCFQPEGQSLSEQVFINTKSKFNLFFI